MSLPNRTLAFLLLSLALGQGRGRGDPASESLLGEAASTAFERFQAAQERIRASRHALCPRDGDEFPETCIDEHAEEWDRLDSVQTTLRRACMIPPPGHGRPEFLPPRPGPRRPDFSRFDDRQRARLVAKLTSARCTAALATVP